MTRKADDIVTSGLSGPWSVTVRVPSDSLTQGELDAPINDQGRTRGTEPKHR